MNNDNLTREELEEQLRVLQSTLQQMTIERRRSDQERLAQQQVDFLVARRQHRAEYASANLQIRREREQFRAQQEKATWFDIKGALAALNARIDEQQQPKAVPFDAQAAFATLYARVEAIQSIPPTPLTISVPQSTPTSSALSVATTITQGGSGSEGWERQRRLLPDVELFTGKKSEFATWSVQMAAKLRLDFAWNSEEMRVMYIFARMSKEASQQLTPWIKMHVREGCEPGLQDRFLAHLESCFTDPWAESNALKKIGVFTQGKSDFGKHFGEFQRLLLEANATTCSDAIKKEWLEKSLSRKLRDRLFILPQNQSFEEYSDQLARISQRMESRGQEQTRKPPYVPGKRRAQSKSTRSAQNLRVDRIL